MPALSTGVSPGVSPAATPAPAPPGRIWQHQAARPAVPGQAMPYSDLGIEVPFLDHLDIQVLPLEGGPIQVIVDLKRQHMNGGMTTHGGLVMTLLDMAMALAGRRGDPRQRYCVTVEMKSNFMRPALTVGARLFAQGTLRQGGSTLAFCDAQLCDEHGTVLASASGTFKYVTPREPGGAA